MYCKYCGTKLADNARFCGSCGKNIEDTVAEPAAAAMKSAFSGNTLLPLIAAMVFGFFRFINFAKGLAGGSVLNLFTNMLSIGAAVLIVLTLFKVLKKDNLFCAIAMFALAFLELVGFSGRFWYVALLLIPAYVIAGLYYLLKGKPISSLFKMIAAIAVWTAGFILFVVYVRWHLPFFSIFSALSIAAAEGLFIFTYTPYK